MKRILTILAAASVAIAVALSFGATSISPFSADGPDLEPSDQLVELGPVQLAMAMYSQPGSVPCEQGQGQNPPFNCGATIAYTSADFPAGDITSVTCTAVNPFSLDVISNCDVVGNGGNSGNVNLDVEIDPLACQGTVFMTVVLIKSNGDQMTLNISPSNNPSACTV